MPTDWITLWLDYEERTGKRPSQTDPDSKRIYWGVTKGVKNNRKGYREFWAQRRINEVDWIAEWVAYVVRTGKRPSSHDPDSSDIYKNVEHMSRIGYPRYVEFFESHRDQGGPPIDWIKEWEDYESRTGKRPSSYDLDSKQIYARVRDGVRRGLPGYQEFWESHRAQRIDWISRWQDHLKRTGKIPSPQDPDSRRIYFGVSQGAKRNLPGYKEFWEANRARGGSRCGN